jgi:hypothetical protein
MSMLIRALAVLLMSLAGLAPTAADAKRPTLNPLEQQQLPQYCWGQHRDERFAGKPEYSIPRICGKAMNHVCPGHIYLIAAQRLSAQPRDRRFHAQKAVGEFEYTKRHMTRECPLQNAVNASLAAARMLEKRR